MLKSPLKFYVLNLIKTSDRNRINPSPTINAKRHFSFFKNNKSSRQNARVSNQKEIKNHSENEAGMETQKC